jgi:hypothetical protein
VAEACLRHGCHYIDLADARGFVAGIERFDQEARQKVLLIVSGASSVPCLTAALIDDYRPRFASLQKVDYGISAAQQTNRGLATLSAILSYVGKPFTTLIDGRRARVYGWQGLPKRARAGSRAIETGRIGPEAASAGISVRRARIRAQRLSHVFIGRRA